MELLALGNPIKKPPRSDEGDGELFCGTFGVSATQLNANGVITSIRQIDNGYQINVYTNNGRSYTVGTGSTDFFNITVPESYNLKITTTLSLSGYLNSYIKSGTLTIYTSSSSSGTHVDSVGFRPAETITVGITTRDVSNAAVPLIIELTK